MQQGQNCDDLPRYRAIVMKSNMDNVWSCSKHRELFQEFYQDFTSSAIKSGSRVALKESQSLKMFYF